jgi:hypothetical protein
LPKDTKANSVITYIITYPTGTTSGAVTTYPSGFQPRILVGFAPNLATPQLILSSPRYYAWWLDEFLGNFSLHSLPVPDIKENRIKNNVFGKVCPFKADHDFILCTLRNKRGLYQNLPINATEIPQLAKAHTFPN